jgi:hypothetical protein
VVRNPLTALGMTETMKREGHKALVHTAAASNLGQMLNKICLEDGIGLVNIVRKPEQAKLPAPPSPSTRSAAARWPAKSSPAWSSRSTRALRNTAATVQACTSRSISTAA